MEEFYIHILNKDTQECMLGSTEELHKLNSEINTLIRLIERLYRHVANTPGHPISKKKWRKKMVFQVSYSSNEFSVHGTMDDD